jgi:hypothetical protein
MHFALPFGYGDSGRSTMLRYIIADSIGQGTEAIGRFFALSLLIWYISLISQAQVIIPPNRYTPRDMHIRDISPPIQVPRFELPGLLRPNPGGGDDDDDPYELLNSLTMEGFVRAEEESGDSVTLEGISPSEESSVYGWIHHPPKITLGVRVASKGESPLVFGERDKVNIEANIYLNGRRIHRLKMLDNGKSGDSESDDGVYSSVFIPRSVGTYEFQAKAKLVVYRQGRIFRKNLNTKRITFYVVAVPYAQVEQPSDGAVLREDFRVTARIFQLKKPYKEMESPAEATLIVSSEEHYEEIPMQRSDSTLTASFNVPKNGIYNISINLRHSIKGRLFSVSTNPVAVRVEKPVSLLVLALYALPVLAVLIIFFLTYAKSAK